MTIKNNDGESFSFNWSEKHLNIISRINWRASMVLAAVVIPDPIVHVKFVTVKIS